MVMSRGPDERTQMHPMSFLLSTCGCFSNRELIDDGAACVVRGTEQQLRDRTAGVKLSSVCWPRQRKDVQRNSRNRA